MTTIGRRLAKAVALPLPRPQLPEHLLQMIELAMQQFEVRAGHYGPAMKAAGHYSFVREKLDEIARAGYECGLVDRAERRLHAVPPPKGAA